MVVFPALGGETISPRCPRPMGAMRLISRGAKRIVIDLEVETLFGKIGVRFSKYGPAGGLLRVEAVDRFHFEQSIMAFDFTGRANLPDDQIARTKVVPAQLRLRNVDILVADAVIGGSQETDAFTHDLEDAAAQLDALLLRLRLPKLKNQGLFLQAVGIWYIEILGSGAQFARGSFSSSRIFMCSMPFGM